MNDLVIPPFRSQVIAAETWMKSLPTEPTDGIPHQIKIPVRHYFSPGIYAREITVPAGALITGEIHKYAQLNILSKGTIRVSIDEEIREISAPHTVVSAAGIKRIAYAVTECVWTTILHTFKTDIKEIEKEFIARDEQEYQEFLRNSTWLLSQQQS